MKVTFARYSTYVDGGEIVRRHDTVHTAIILAARLVNQRMAISATNVPWRVIAS